MRSLIFILVCIHCVAIAETNLKALFAAGKCDKLLRLGSKLVSSEDIVDVNDLAQTEELLARCYFQRNEMKNAEEQLRRILFLNPAFEINAFETPAPLVESFNKLKAELAKKSRALQQIKENADHNAENIETTSVIRKMSPLAPLMPFGAAQFEYGAKIKGIIIASAEALFLVANIASYWIKRSLNVDTGALGAYNLAQIFQFVSLGLFVAIYAYGFADGFSHRSDIIQESLKTQSTRVSKEEFLQKLDSIKRQGH